MKCCLRAALQRVEKRVRTPEEYNMRELNVIEIEQVNGGKITENSDGTGTTDNANDCETIYGGGLLSRGARIDCEWEVLETGSHTTKKKKK
jgi:hypothetical protein